MEAALRGAAVAIPGVLGVLAVMRKRCSLASWCFFAAMVLAVVVGALGVVVGGAGGDPQVASVGVPARPLAGDPDHAPAW